MKIKYQATIVLSLCSIFLFLKYIAQLFPSLISNTLMQQFQLSGIEIGILASSYYYSYSLMQLISGVLMDKYNVRLSATIAIMSVSIGLLGFASTNTFYTMCLYRALMGIGCAFATTLYMKCAALWTDEKLFPIISSFLATATMLGAAVGSEPIALLFDQIGWKQSLIYIGMFGLALSLFALFFIKNNKKATMTKAATAQETKQVLKNPANYWLLVYSGLTFSPVVILGGLWGVPFLQLKYHATSAIVAKLISIMFIGHALGSPLWALLSNYLNNKKDLMKAANVVAFSVLLLIIYGTPSFNQAGVLFFIFGMSVGCFMLSFSICRMVNSVVALGFAVAFINTGEGIVGSILEPAIGWLLDLLKEPGSREFSLMNYQQSLVLLPICYIVSTFIITKLPEARKDNLSTNEEFAL